MAINFGASENAIDETSTMVRLDHVAQACVLKLADASDIRGNI